MKLSDFVQEGDTVLDRIDYPLFRALAAKQESLDLTPEEFVMAMRYAVMNNVYHQEGGQKVILGMKINII